MIGRMGNLNKIVMKHIIQYDNYDDTDIMLNKCHGSDLCYIIIGSAKNKMWFPRESYAF